MSHYKSNLRDVEFNLFEVFGRQEVLGAGPFAEVDEETARDMLAEVDRACPSAATAPTRSFTGRADLNEREIRERMSGNLCRCAAYQNIVAAIRHVAASTAPDRD